MSNRERTIRQMMDPANVQRMGEVRRAVEELIKTRFRENTEAAVISGGLMQLVRMLLDQYAEKDRELHADLVAGAVAFLKGAGDPAVEAKKRRPQRGLWVPKGYIQ